MKTFSLVFFFLSLFFGVTVEAMLASKKPLILVPSGDSESFGRLLFEKYERGVSYALVKEVGSLCKNKGMNIEVPLSTVGGRKQLLELVNCKEPVCVVQFGLYRSEAVLPEMSILVYSTDLLKDRAFEATHASLISCKAVEAVYKEHWCMSDRVARSLGEWAARTGGGRYAFLGLAYAPCMQLLGYDAPAIMIEIGISDDNGWQQLCDILFEMVSRVGQIVCKE